MSRLVPTVPLTRRRVLIYSLAPRETPFICANCNKLSSLILFLSLHGHIVWGSKRKEPQHFNTVSSPETFNEDELPALLHVAAPAVLSLSPGCLAQTCQS